MDDPHLSAPRDFADLRAELRGLASGSDLPRSRGSWIYGAGGFGRKLAAELTRIGGTVLGFIDRSAAGHGTVHGLPCRHPDEIDLSDAAGAVYVHGIMNPDTPSAEIVVWASRRGFDAVLFAPQLYRRPGFTLRHYWLDRPSRTIENLDSLAALWERLDDDESRDVLASILRFRLEGDPRRAPAFTATDLYTPDFLPIFDDPLTFVDGGAYTGDSISSLLDRGVRVRDWIAFEPDARNVAELRRTAEVLRPKLSSWTIIEAGLSDRNGRASFSSGGDQGSHILAGDRHPSGSTEIPVVRLDDVVHRMGPVYVKMDIEGAESAALAGMDRTIARRPILAVSLYHGATDLWDIPLQVARSYPGSRMRIRQHREQAFDTVLYVWPA